MWGGREMTIRPANIRESCAHYCEVTDPSNRERADRGQHSNKYFPNSHSAAVLTVVKKTRTFREASTLLKVTFCAESSAKVI
jgi:hypothetical protein